MEPHPQEKPIYQFGSFQLDASQRQLRRDGSLVEVTRKAFDLLVLLVQNAGRLVEKEMLLRTGWPDDVYVEEGNVPKQIEKLRKALGDSKSAPRYIETVPGHGYRFIHPMRELRRALLVLQFWPMGDTSGEDMMGLGLASAVISKLDSLNIEELVVRPRSAIFRYDKPGKGPLDAAREQNASYVLAGFFQRAGARIRLDLDFLRVDDGEQIWSRGFTAEITDSLAVQQALAEEIARDVARHFGHDPQAQPPRGDETASTEAYQLYVQGRFHWNKFTSAGFKEAILSFRQAIKKDPHYAKAYAGISECWTWAALYSLLPPDKAFPRARRWAEQALAIYPDLSGAHTTLAFIEMFVSGNHEGAAARFERAIYLYPNNVRAHLGYALLLTGLKQFDRALTEIDKALEIYSVSFIVNVAKGMILFQAQRYEDALRQLSKTSKLDEGSDAPHYVRALIFVQQDDCESALAAIGKTSDNPLNNSVLAYVKAMKGEETEARQLLKTLETTEDGEPYISPFHLATVHLALGQRSQALGWLEQARERHDPWYIWLHTDPRLAPLRTDPQV